MNLAMSSGMQLAAVITTTFQKKERVRRKEPSERERGEGGRVEA